MITCWNDDVPSPDDHAENRRSASAQSLPDDVHAVDDLAEHACGDRRRCGVGASVMKNWPPLVLGPRLAIDRMPALSWRSFGLKLVGEVVSGSADALTERVAALDHEAVDHAVEDGAVVIRLLCAFLVRPRIGPLLRSPQPT